MTFHPEFYQNGQRLYTWIEAEQIGHYPTVVDANIARKINVTLKTRLDVKTFYDWNSSITNDLKIAKFFGSSQVMMDATQ